MTSVRPMCKRSAWPSSVRKTDAPSKPLPVIAEDSHLGGNCVHTSSRRAKNDGQSTASVELFDGAIPPEEDVQAAGKSSSPQAQTRRRPVRKRLLRKDMVLSVLPPE